MERSIILLKYNLAKSEKELKDTLMQLPKLKMSFPESDWDAAVKDNEAEILDYKEAIKLLENNSQPAF